MPGLWLNANEYVDFADTADRAALAGELATRATAMEWIDFMGLLPDPDPVLAKLDDRGDKVLDGLLADGHLISVVQSRKLGTLKKEFHFVPGCLKGEEPSAAAVKLRDELVEDLERVDLYHLVSGILDAPLFGLAPVEVLWQADRQRLRIADLVVKPARWFGFDGDNRPRFRSAANPWQGEELPFGKFVFARHFPTYDNPYGLRLLSRCFWPAAFKKGGIKFWVTLAEKYGMPFLLGKYRSGAPPAEQNDMLAKLAAMVRDAVAVIPQGGTVEVLNNQGAASADLHERLKTAMDAEMSKVIMGQTLTAEVSASGGSRAQGQVHEEILEDFRAADQKLVKTAMEEIAWLYGRINAPGVPTPAFTWYEEEEPQTEFAERDKTLQETGVRFRKSYYVRRYRLQEDDFDLAVAVPAAPAEFAEPSPSPEADPVTHWAQRAMAQADGSALLEAVRQALQSAADFEDAGRRLEALRDWPLTDLAEALEQGLLLAQLAGRSEIQEAAEFAEPFDLPFAEAIAYFRQKLSIPTATWTGLWKGEHARAFTIAGALRDDLLADFRTAIDTALADGRTLADFRREFDRLVSRYGWSYNGGRGWRTRVIFETNLRTAHQAGRYAQMKDPDVARYRPYWRYRHGDSRQPRPHHLAWDGLVLAADDPFWQTHYPPNGWGCKCFVEALSERQIQALGKTGPDRAPAMETYQWTDRQSGAVHTIPTGIDPGWDYNVGEQWLNPATGQRERR